jgi:hypothetical protein
MINNHLAVGALVDDSGRKCRVERMRGPCRCAYVLDPIAQATESHYHVVAHDVRTGGIRCIGHVRLDGSSVLGDRPRLHVLAPAAGITLDLFAA